MPYPTPTDTNGFSPPAASGEVTMLRPLTRSHRCSSFPGGGTGSRFGPTHAPDAAMRVTASAPLPRAIIFTCSGQNAGVSPSGLRSLSRRRRMSPEIFSAEDGEAGSLSAMTLPIGSDSLSIASSST